MFPCSFVFLPSFLPIEVLCSGSWFCGPDVLRVFSRSSSPNSNGCTPCLDRDLCIVDGKLEWTTHEKEQATFMYVPRNSCHPPGVFRALIQGEARRLLRTNKTPEQRRKAFARFSARLQRRGYSRDEIALGFHRALVKAASPRQAVTGCVPQRCFLTLPYSFTLNSTTVRKCISKYQHLVKHPVSLAYKVQANQFLRRYHATWAWTWA